MFSPGALFFHKGKMEPCPLWKMGGGTHRAANKQNKPDVETHRSHSPSQR